jgi:hypothetical protein
VEDNQRWRHPTLAVFERRPSEIPGLTLSYFPISATSYWFLV